MKTWKEVCHEHLPKPEYAKLRERLLHLDDIHGPAMRKRFPPREGSAADEEEQPRLASVSLFLSSLGIHCTKSDCAASDTSSLFTCTISPSFTIRLVLLATHCMCLYLISY